MSRILEAEFRKELYKNLVDAGYEKQEAQAIIGKKYYAELHKNVCQGVDEFLASIVQEKFDITLDYEGITSKIEELKKLKEFAK